jgi:hypothetical protein
MENLRRKREIIVGIPDIKTIEKSDSHDRVKTFRALCPP